VGVAEQSDALRLERGGQFGALFDVGDALLRQPVHQVHVDALDAGVAQHRDGVAHLLDRLHAADGVLHVRCEVLDAEAGAVDAQPCQRLHQRRRHPARIEFDGVLGEAGEIEMHRHPVHEVGQMLGAEDRRRAAAPMHVDEPPCRQ